MRRACKPLLLAAFAAVACGGNSTGFRIDNVSLSPDDIPIASSSSAPLNIGADVFDDTHEVLSAWVVSEDGRFWIQLERGTDPHWGASIPLSRLSALPAATYRFDVHAEDDAGRALVLVDAVRMKIRLE